MRKGQRYLIVCTRTVERVHVGLGESGKIRKNQYLTETGESVKSINSRRNPVAVYTHGTSDFPFDEFPYLNKFFKPVLVFLTLSSQQGIIKQ